MTRPEQHCEHASNPYASTLLAEIDKLNDDLRLMRETVSTLVDQRDAARREANVAANTAIRFHHRVLQLEAELAEVNDRCDQTAAARDRFRRERDAEREARAASATSFAFTIAARGLADHPWQEYNAHGYLCHYPGCQLTPDEHEETP